jgi:hypothetical protein
MYDTQTDNSYSRDPSQVDGARFGQVALKFNFCLSICFQRTWPGMSAIYYLRDIPTPQGDMQALQRESPRLC